jgi:hypothetical protein
MNDRQDRGRREHYSMRVTKLLAVFFLLSLAACGAVAPEATSTPVPLSTAAPTVEGQLPPTEEPVAATATPVPTASAPATEAPVVPTAPPTQAAQPTQAAEPTQEAQPTVPLRMIALEVPQDGAVVRSPVVVRGRVSVTPFEATLRGRVYDAEGQVVGEAPIMLTTEMGQPGTFEGEIPFNVSTSGPGRVEVAEESMKDGSVVVSAVANVTLDSQGASLGIVIPAADEAVTLPLHIMARVGEPGELVRARLRWQDGTVLVDTFTVLRGEDGRGLLIGSLDWQMESQPPQSPSQPAVLELRNAAEALLASQPVRVLSADDPEVMQVTLHFVLGEQLQPVQRNIPRTAAVGTAALEELLWGPPPLNLAGFETAIPMPEDVLNYHARGSDWGPRVTLRELTIVDGVATADFSQELQAYGGGSLRVMLIRQQIEQTLRQFSTVQEVRIAIEGETEAVLEP